MKKPLRPPKFDFHRATAEFFRESRASKGDDSDGIIMQKSPSPVTDKGEYIHWDKLRHLSPPEGMTAEKHWQMLKLARTTRMIQLPFAKTPGHPFWFCPLDELAKFQHWLDKHAAGILGAEEPAAFDDDRRTRFLMNGIMEEAVHSSILEGAATTRAAALEILAHKNPKPKDHGETMIVNNYRAMQFIQSVKSEKLTLSIILELHRILTAGTISENAAGRLRRAEDDIVIADADQTILHHPPRADTVHSGMEELCDFANGESPKTFLHPAMRAMILHFMTGYIHPFADGNGRTARALFYWAMARDGYWLMSSVSISAAVRRAPGRYKRAFLLTETDDNDLTYFLLHQAEIIRKAFAQLAKHVRKETHRVRDGWTRYAEILNRRQISFLRHAEKHPDRAFTVYGHRARHNVSYPTALADFRKLMQMKIITRRKEGAGYVYELREGVMGG